MKFVHWPLMGGLLHLVQRGGAWVSCPPPRPLLAVLNVTPHQSTASVPISYRSAAVTESCVRVVSTAAHNANEPKVEVARTADDEEDVESPVRVQVSGEQTAVPPAGLLSPLPTANGPTSRVVTRPRLSRTLDLSTNLCVEAATAAPEMTGLRSLATPSDVTQASNTATGNVSKLQRNRKLAAVSNQQ